MNGIEAFILGIIQGFTEFIPVSSSGHLEICHALFGIDTGKDLLFIILVHGATVLSTLVVFRKEIFTITRDVLRFEWNPSTRYLVLILLSMIPVGIVGLLFKDQVESLFTGNILFVGLMLMVTSLFLLIAHLVRKGEKGISWLNSVIIGIAQAVAVIPGISRSGATIATGLILGVKKEEITKFSFLMVLIPVIGATLIDLYSAGLAGSGRVAIMPLLVGAATAFIAGLFACRWMIEWVKKSKMIYFSLYCFLVGLVAVILG
jgi:undecaprenyl-diphosphatase